MTRRHRPDGANPRRLALAGTSHGLFRYDGANFEKLAPLAGPQLLSSAVADVRAADGGDLWIVYGIGGVSILHDGRLRHIAGSGKDARLGAVYSMEIDRDGSMWFASPNGLRHYSAGKWHNIGPEAVFPRRTVYALYIDHDARLWASNEKRISQPDRTTGRFVDSSIDGTAAAMADSTEGRLWLSEETVWRVLPEPAAGRMARPAGFRFHTGSGFGMFDRDGNHWQLHCPNGVCRTGGTPAWDATGFSVENATSDDRAMSGGWVTAGADYPRRSRRQHLDRHAERPRASVP